MAQTDKKQKVSDTSEPVHHKNFWHYKDSNEQWGGEWIEMTKKLPSGHNIGGSTKQKRRKEHKQNSN